MFSPTQKIVAWISSLRLSTRFWFDIVPPTVMVLLLSDHDGTNPLKTWEFALILVAVVSFHVGQTMFNDISDVDVDRRSVEPGRNQRPLVVGKLTRGELTLSGCLMIGISVASALILPWPSAALLLLALPLGLAYNFKPFHLAGRPVLAQLFWPAIWALIFFLCISAMRAVSWAPALPYLIFIILFMGLGEGLTQDIRDADNDAAGGRRTTVVTFGVPRCAIAAWLFQALSIIPLLALAFTRPTAATAVAASVVSVICWLAVFARLTSRLGKRYDKREGRITHVGSIITFTLINMFLLMGFAIR